MRAGLVMAMVGVWLSGSATAHAFCGFYVSGADASLYNDATMVVLMREGTTTVLSMQNAYEGPPEEFALVVPVPVVLEEENVKTLPHEVFDRVDALAAPRLVEYWEQDPCNTGIGGILGVLAGMNGAWNSPVSGFGGLQGFGVTVEAEFEVGEYDIVILGAEDSGGLDAWLRANDYNIPDGAEPVLRPYVAQGTKFFVAKVSPERVTFEDGRAVLSPLRVHYDSESFSLPVRLGLLNSQGTQDLIVHVLAPGQRYEVANYPNATIPTNIRVKDETRDSFGAFYDALFEEVRERQPGAVVTEYAWDARTCDPCPVPGLNGEEMATLGMDVLESRSGFVLTRLHYRYGTDELDEDLVFRAAPPIVGGRGMPGADGKLEEQRAASRGPTNNFQGRYVIVHEWEGEVACDEPVRGRWGGPPRDDGAPSAAPTPLAARGGPTLAQAPSAEVSLASLVAEDLAPLLPAAATRQAAGAPTADPENGTEEEPARAAGEDGCGSCATHDTSAAGALWPLLALVPMLRRRR